MKPAPNYVALGEPVNFYTVVESTRRRGEIVIGYRLQNDANNVEKAYGVVVNPQKSDRIVFSAEDRIIVIAEN